VPPKADLGDLRGLASGLDGRISAMINGGDFDGAKAYKDSKVRRSGQFFFGLCLQACCWSGLSMIIHAIPVHSRSRVQGSGLSTALLPRCSLTSGGGTIVLGKVLEQQDTALRLFRSRFKVQGLRASSGSRVVVKHAGCGRDSAIDEARLVFCMRTVESQLLVLSCRDVTRRLWEIMRPMEGCPKRNPLLEGASRRTKQICSC
jgi:hypothetical protein